MTNNVKYPERIGFAADLLIPAVSPLKMPPLLDVHILLHLGDLLILHDTILISLDFLSPVHIYAAFTVDELKPFFDAGRIKFCALIPISSKHRRMERSPFELEDSSSEAQERFFKNLYERLHIESKGGRFRSNIRDIITQIESNFIKPKLLEGKAWGQFYTYMMEKFFDSMILSDIKGENYYNLEIGYEGALEKVIASWSLGTYPIYFDKEILSILGLFDQELKFKEQMSSIPISSSKQLENLHSIKNLPSVIQLLCSETWNKNNVFKAALSDEAADLRQWLKKNAEPGIDVRDIYYRKLKELPSKKTWTNLLRFTTSSILTTSLSFALSGNPVLATILGLIIGITDLKHGNKIIEKAIDPYHPKEWLETLERNKFEK